MKMLLDQRGGLNVLLVPLLLCAVFLFGAIGFGAWAYNERQSYKNDSDSKADAAVKVAVERANSVKDNEFLQKEKEPYKDYSSPAQYGSFSFRYPKTWSAYSNEGADALTVSMQPDVVVANNKAAYALKVEIVQQSYNQVVTSVEGNIRQGKVKAVAYSLPKVPSAVGLRLDGQVAPNKNGAAVYLPIRDKTLKITTEAPDKVADFNNIILPNFVFSP